MHRHDAHGIGARAHVALDLQIGLLQSGEKFHQRGCLAGLVFERQREKFVQRVARFRAEPRQHVAAAVLGAENARVKEERRQLRRRPAPLREAGEGADVPGRGRVAQGIVQRAGAARRQRQQIVIVEADQRCLQHNGKRQIVIGQQGGPAGGDQVHHRNVLGQLQPVGPGHRHLRLLQGADHRLEERPAAAHQNHHVAGADRAAPARLLVFYAFARVRRDQGRDFRCDPFGHHDRRVAGVALVERHFPVARLRCLIALHHRPELDHAGQVILPGLVHRLRPVGRQPVVMILDGKHAVDRVENALAGPEGALEFDKGELLLRLQHAPLDVAAHRVEGTRLRTLEGEDRLLLVADREEGAMHVALSRAVGEFMRDGFQNVPLIGRGVLRLVDENMVDAAVELVQHPARIGALEQAARRHDQVAEIEQAARFLFGAIGLQDLAHDGQQCARARHHMRGLAALAQRADALAFGFQRLADLRVLFGKTLGDDLHARRARLRHEDAFIQAQRISALSRCLRVAQGVGDLDVIRRARGDQRGETGHVPGQQAILEESPIDLIDRLRRLNAQAGGEQAGVNVAALVTFEPRRLRE